MTGRRTWASDEEREAWELDHLDAAEATIATLVSGSGLTYGAAADISQIDSGDAAAAGAVGKPADAGHQHALLAPGTPAASAVGDTASVGTGTKVALDTHRHAREAFAAPAASAVGDAGTTGTATTVPHSDHKHAREAFGAAVAQSDYGSAVDGTATTVSHSDHKHGTPTRRGTRLRRAASQAIVTGSSTAVSWDTEDQDTDGFIAVTGTTVTIPTGLDGVYGLTLFAVGAVTGRSYGEIAVTSGITGLPTPFRTPMDPAEDRVLVTAVTPLAAGDTFICNLFHSTGANVSFTAWLSCYRLGA